MAKSGDSTFWMWMAWGGLGSILSISAGILAAASGPYWAEVELIDMPSLALAAGLVAAGAVFLLSLPLLRASLAAGYKTHRSLLWLIIVFGAVFRLLLMWSTPAFEDDWYRYLWDGAVTVSGYNPYAVSPDEAQGEVYHYTLQALARRSGVVIERINHSHLKTIYPPVAQASFALAYVVKPFSLTAWRGLLLAAEVATLVLLLLLLAHAQRSQLWVVLYWWNPVVVKEIINSAHMEGIVTPLVLGALLLSVRKRPLAATATLGLAIGAKLWPVMLAPLILRPLADQPRRLVVAMCVLASLMTLWAWPVIVGRIDGTSGFVAFAQHWKTNSALFPVLQGAAAWLLSGLELPATAPGVIVRAILALSVGFISLWMARIPIKDAQDLMVRAGIVTGALFLLSPAQFPWYAIWMLPYLCFRPWLGLLAVTALVPIYYSAFHFIARDTHEIFRTYVVWLIWLPIWSLLAAEIWSRTARRSQHGGSAHAR